MLTTTLALTELRMGDWLVLGLYFAALIGIGLWSSRKRVESTDDYFLASRSMPVWAVAFSILSTAQSAATYVGVPQQSFDGSLVYLSSNIGGLLAALVLAVVFIPAYYRRNVNTPYQLLEARFGPLGRTATSWAYLVGRVFASGARIFIAAIPTSLVLFGDLTPWHLAIIIVGFTILGVALSFVGGVRSVIWIDVLQVSVYLGAAIATIVFLFGRIPVDIPTIVNALQHPPAVDTAAGTVQATSKLSVISFSLDPTKEFTFWTAITGFLLLTIASHGADQDLVQRMLTCKSAARGSWSVISGVLIGVPAVLIFLVLGLLLWIFFRRPDLMGSAAPAYSTAGSDSVFQLFAIKEMTGGLAGLVIAGLFACGPAGINSGLSAMSSTFVNDLYKRARPNRDDAHYLRVGRLGVLGSGVALGAMALVCIAWYDANDRSIISFVLSVMNFAYAGLLGVFITALFTRRGRGSSVVAALIVGFLVTLVFQTPLWMWIARALPGTITPTGTPITTASIRDALPFLKLAFPWQLCLAAAASTIACALPKGPTRTDNAPAATQA